MTTLQLLKEVKKLLNSPARWVKFELEKTASDGKQSYCLVGALGKIIKNDSRAYDQILKESGKFARAINLKGLNDSNLQYALVDYNNRESLKYSGMIARINRAIKRLESVKTY